MRSLLIFLFGVGFGAGGTLLWLRKDIRKELDAIENSQNKEEEVPFSMENKDKNEQIDMSKYIPEDKPEALKDENRVQYHKIIDENYILQNMEKNIKENIESLNDDSEEDLGDVDASFGDETDGGVFEIDEDDFVHDHSNEKERLVYYRGDKIMSTESGTIIKNPFPLVGGEWENCVGNYAVRTAFIRNPKLVTDYEIYVEDGFYSDEFGDEENFRED